MKSGTAAVGWTMDHERHGRDGGSWVVYLMQIRKIAHIIDCLQLSSLSSILKRIGSVGIIL
jgi:hypothetical protein